MSSNQTTFSSSSSFSFSSSSSSSDGQTTGQRHVQQTYTDPSGTTVKQASQNMGEPIVEETRRYDPQGRELLSGPGGDSASRRIEDVSDADQAQRDREYEERMEDE